MPAPTVGRIPPSGKFWLISARCHSARRRRRRSRRGCGRIRRASPRSCTATSALFSSARSRCRKRAGLPGPSAWPWCRGARWRSIRRWYRSAASGCSKRRCPEAEHSAARWWRWIVGRRSAERGGSIFFSEQNRLRPSLPACYEPAAACVGCSDPPSLPLRAPRQSSPAGERSRRDRA